jgi:anti-anti-sigma factor
MAECIQDAVSMLHVCGEMTIYRAHELMPEFSAAVRDCPAGAGVCADLSKVTEFDTAGLQILLLARRMARAGGERFEVLDPSECVKDVLTLCNLSDMIGAPPDVESIR